VTTLSFLPLHRKALSRFLMTSLVLALSTTAVGAGQASATQDLAIRTGPDFVPTQECVRGEFTCEGDVAGEVSGYYTYMRGMFDGDDSSTSDRLLDLNFRGRSADGSLVQSLNAVWQAGGFGNIVDVSPDCSPDGLRVQWTIRYWRAELESSSDKGYGMRRVVTNADGKQILPGGARAPAPLAR